MPDIIVPASLRAFQPEVAAEMLNRNPLNADQVAYLDGSLVPVEVLDDLSKAAKRRGVSVGEYVVSTAFRQALDDLTGNAYD